MFTLYVVQYVDAVFGLFPNSNQIHFDSNVLNYITIKPSTDITYQASFLKITFIHVEVN